MALGLVDTRRTFSRVTAILQIKWEGTIVTALSSVPSKKPWQQQESAKHLVALPEIYFSFLLKITALFYLFLAASQH